MKSTEALPIENRTLRMEEEMSSITFSELVKELTGKPFETIYKDYLIYGATDEQSNME